MQGKIASPQASEQELDEVPADEHSAQRREALGLSKMSTGRPPPPAPRSRIVHLSIPSGTRPADDRLAVAGDEAEAIDRALPSVPNFAAQRDRNRHTIPISNQFCFDCKTSAPLSLACAARASAAHAIRRHRTLVDRGSVVA
jgi:hypothetical protein